MSRLHSYPAADIDQLGEPLEIRQLSLETPALEFFTDFYTVRPFVIESSMPAADVKIIMRKTHVRLYFVINEENQFLGIVSADDLIDRRILKIVSQGIRREEISVTDVMTPKENLVVLKYDKLTRATIGDLIEILKESGQQYCLVADSEINKIRGIYSASDLSRMLHLTIDIRNKSDFYKVFSKIA